MNYNNYNIETGATESIISLPTCSRVINCDVSEDISIPEGLPDVRRVLAVRENILSPAKFIGARAVDMSGSVDYTVIYLGADGNIYSAPFSAEYSFSLPLDSIDSNESVSVICSLSPDGYNVRMSTPRRLQIRAGIRASALCFGRMVATESIDGIDDESAIERLELSCENSFFNCETSDIVTLSDEYLLSEGDRIIYSSADVFINDVRIDGEIALAVGEAVVKLALQNGDNIEIITRKIPFEAETDLEELDLSEESVLCRAYGSVNELDVSVIDGRAHIDVGVVLEACMAQNRSVRYTRDMYSTKQICKAEYKKCSLPIALFNKNVNMTQSEQILAANAGFETGMEILDVWGSAYLEDSALEGRRYVLRGKVRYKMLCRRDGNISTCDCELPFKYEAELGEVDVSGSCADIKVMGARVRCDGENLLVEGELAISATIYGLCEVDMLSRATLGDAIEQKKNQIVVCFKGSDESVFDLAKRYSVPFSKITEEAHGNSFVIIER